jgi:hypothetical protein
LSIGIDFGIGIDQNSWYRTGIVSNPKKLVSPITTNQSSLLRSLFAGPRFKTSDPRTGCVGDYNQSQSLVPITELIPVRSIRDQSIPINRRHISKQIWIIMDKLVKQRKVHGIGEFSRIYSTNVKIHPLVTLKIPFQQTVINLCFGH